MSGAKKIRVTQIRSANGRLQSHKATLSGLGLRRIRHTVELDDTPQTRGMLNKINYMIRVED